MKKQVNRRTVLTCAALVLAGVGMAALVARAEEKAAPRTPPKFENAYFYDAQGKFLPERAKDAYIEVMKYHGYPVMPGLREKLWVSDYGIGEFARLGLGAWMFINNAEEDGYRFMQMDLYLLPNQMLPEHYHLKTEKAREKMEAWLVRHGSSCIIGEGEETPGIREKMPESQRASATVFHAQLTTPGQCVKLNRITARHSQIAGPEGAIITEVANFHDDSGVRHTNPKLVFP